MNILLTRPLKQINALAQRVKDSGHCPVICPSLRIEKLEYKLLQKKYDVIIFVSLNAVDYGYSVLFDIDYQKIFCVGKTTANQLIKKGFSVEAYPLENPSSEALLALQPLVDLRQKSVLIVRGKGGAETLKKELVKQNNQVDYCEVYERVGDYSLTNQTTLRYFLSLQNIVLSASSVDNLQALIVIAKRINNLKKLKQCRLIVLSERIKNQAVLLGFSRVVVTPSLNDKGIISALLNINTLDRGV
jgi:uroporphyrinogen-III synthase